MFNLKFNIMGNLSEKRPSELTEVESALRSLIYAVETKDKQHPNHPRPLGEIFLAHILTEVKENAIKFNIPLVKIDY
jgi:hypothetical protein